MARRAALPRLLEASEPDGHDDPEPALPLSAPPNVDIDTGIPQLTSSRVGDNQKVAMDANPLSIRSTIARRSLSGGGIAGAVIGSVVGVALILFCLSPFLLRRRRNAKFRREQSALQAEMGLAAESAPGRQTVLASPATDRRLSADHWGQPTAGDAHRQAKETDMDGHSYDNVSPSGTAVPQYAAAFTAPPQTGDGYSGAYAAGQPPPGPLTMPPPPPPPPAPVPSGTDQGQRRRQSSITNAIEGLADKATAFFHRSSTQSSSRSVHMTSPTRSPTRIETQDVHMPTFSAEHSYSPVAMTGSAAEYFSGAPLSPPSSEHSPPPQEIYGSTEVGTTHINLRTIPQQAAIQRLSGPSRQGTQADGFSPMSPTSPGLKIEDDSEDGKRGFPDDDGLRGMPTALLRQRMPSPPQPAPGTVNPMDVWAPANASERVHRVEAELVRMQESPPPQASNPPVQAYHDVVEEEQQLNQPLPVQLPQPTIVEPDPESRSDEFIAHETLDTDVSTPPPGTQSSAPSAYATPDTRLTEPTPAYMSTPSPMSNEPGTPAHSSVSGASPRSYTCEQCGRIFDQVHKLNHHKRYHERPHECAHQGCGKRFGTKTHLDRHINDKHKKTRKYHCTIADCAYSKQGGKSFPRKDNWRRHMQNKHSLNPDDDPVEVVDETMTGT